MGVWPFLFLVGALAQWRITGRGFDHNEAIGHKKRKIVITRKPEERARPERERERENVYTPYGDVVRTAQHIPGDGQDTIRPSLETVLNAQKRNQKRVPETTVDRRARQHSRYRHLYQIRRVNGDVIAQSYVQNIHDKLSPALRNITHAEEAVGIAPPPPLPGNR